MSFTHLHVHTEYSLLDGSSKIRELTARVKELGMGIPPEEKDGASILKLLC